MKIEEKVVKGKNDDENKIVLKIPIYKKNFPFFFIQNNLDIQNYRISTSFKYLNKVWDLKINIIRDINIKNKNKILVNNNPKMEIFDLIYDDYNLKIYKFIYKKEVIFFVDKEFNGEHGKTLIFFGYEYFNIKMFLEDFDYLAYLDNLDQLTQSKLSDTET